MASRFVGAVAAGGHHRALVACHQLWQHSQTDTADSADGIIRLHKRGGEGETLGPSFGFPQESGDRFFHGVRLRNPPWRGGRHIQNMQRDYTADIDRRPSNTNNRLDTPLDSLVRNRGIRKNRTGVYGRVFWRVHQYAVWGF